MTISQLASVVGLLGVILGLTSIAYTYLRASAVKLRIEMQDGFILVLQAKLSEVEKELAATTARATALDRENATLRTIVTSKHEIERLQASEDSHHEDTIAVLRQIREAVS